MLKRGVVLNLVTLGLLVVGFSACTPQAPSPSKTGEAPTGATPSRATATSAPAAKAVSPASPEAAKTAASPVAAAKAASPSPVAGTTTTTRTEPQGKVVYAWFTSLATAWNDPQENGALVTPYIFQYIMHDAVVKNLPGQPFAPSLAESYEIAPDFKSATFKLREGIKFHNGEPVTSEDVKFTFENYKGANAKLLKDKTERIETPDARTVRFIFSEPFLDFLVLYGTPASGAGWVVPAKYYQEVGPDGFKKNPIGAGPFKLVRQDAGSTLEFEAVPDYWRKSPGVKTLIVRSVPEASTRVAQLQTGEADLAYLGPGPLVDTVKQDPNLTLAASLGSMFWLEFPGFEKPDSPFNNVKVRQAVSLALDRQALSDAEYAGFAQPVSNWLPADWPGGIEGPQPEENLEEAKQLMAEAGYPDGFDVEQLTPITGFETVAERMIGQLRQIGIRTKLNTMERAAFDQQMREGPDAVKGMIFNASGSPGDVASRIRAYALCNGITSRTCVPEIDERFRRYEASLDAEERQRLIADIQQYMMDNYIFVAVLRHASLGAQGPRILNQPDDIWGSIPQYSTYGPYEDIQLKE